MTKSELIEAVAVRNNIPRSRAEYIVNTVFDVMKKSFAKGEGVEIRGFGSFVLREHKAYAGRNPKTGAKVMVNKKIIPLFRVGKELRKRVDESRLTHPELHLIAEDD